MAPASPVVTLPFAVDPTFAKASRPFGVTAENARVEVDDERLVARFGPWRVETPLSNIVSAEVSGPYAWYKVIGPAHLSLRDRGLTFATNARRGVCLSFREPVRGMDPLGLLRHPGLTVTVAEPERLLDLVAGRGDGNEGGPAQDTGRAEGDALGERGAAAGEPPTP